jgi:peroxiredoxin
MRGPFRIALTVSVVLGVILTLFVLQRLLSSSSGSAQDFYSLSSAGINLGAADDSSASVGSPAPDFTLLDLDGSPVTLSSLRGKTVLLNFWATWCVPCRQEMPDIEEAFLRRQADGIVVLAINLKEERGQAKTFADKYGLTFPILLDSKGEVGKAYRLTGLPESWIVGPDGVLKELKIGAFTAKELNLVLDEALRPAGRAD